MVTRSWLMDTANVHPRNILGSRSSFDRERLSPFGSLSSRCWEPVSLLNVRSKCPYQALK